MKWMGISVELMRKYLGWIGTYGFGSSMIGVIKELTYHAHDPMDNWYKTCNKHLVMTQQLW